MIDIKKILKPTASKLAISACVVAGIGFGLHHSYETFNHAKFSDLAGAGGEIHVDGKATPLTPITSITGAGGGTGLKQQTSSTSIAVSDAMGASLTKAGLTIVGQFPLPPGFPGRGVLLKQSSGQVVPAYLEGDDYLFIGYLMDQNFTNLTSNYVDQYAAKYNNDLAPQGTSKSSPISSGQTTNNIEKTVSKAKATESAVHDMMENGGFFGTQIGTGPLKLTVFYDPNCIFCHKFWTELTAMPDWQSKFTVNWVPVAILKDSSAGKGAAILAGGISALDQNETTFDQASETGGIEVSSDQNLISEVQHNTTSWTSGLKNMDKNPGTPTIVVNNAALVIGDPGVDFLNKMAALSSTIK